MNIQKIFKLSFFYNNQDFLYRIKMHQEFFMLLSFGANPDLLI